MTPRAPAAGGDWLIAEMHAAEVEIDETLVRRLPGEQVPDFLELSRCEGDGSR